MKAFQDRSVVEEGVISRLHKRNKILTNEQAQYKDALCTLNKEVTELKEKLKKEASQRKKEQEAKATVEKELTALLRQVETVKADIVTDSPSQPFIDSCAIYYGDRLEDFLKQVKFVYLYLDLSKVSIEDPLPSTPVSDTIIEETNNSIGLKPNPKDDSVVLA